MRNLLVTFSTVVLALLLAATADSAVIAKSSVTTVPRDHSVNGDIKMVTVGGTYYSIGFQVGQAMTAIISSRLALPDYQNFRNILKTSKGAGHLNRTLFETTLSAFPEMIDELQGVSDGSGISFPDIWLMNIVDELGAYQQHVINVHNEHHAEHSLMKEFPVFPRGGGMPKKNNKNKNGVPPESDMHCTDVFTNEDPSMPAWGHNEDSGLYDVNHTYMVKARIYNNNSQDGDLLEEFQAYTYAGSVAGKAYQWNSNGLLFSCNALFANDLAFADTQSLPRAVHNRVVLRSRTVEEAVSYANALPSTTGYSLNIGYAWKNETAVTGRSLPFQFARYRNVEIWPMGKRSVSEIYPKSTSSNPYKWSPVVPRMKHHFFHTNDYQVLNVSYFVDPSSVDRLARLHEMPVPMNSTDVRMMLGDTQNLQHPVYRYGTDGCYTMSTVLFNFDTHTLDIYTANPKNHTPVLSFPMDMSMG